MANKRRNRTETEGVLSDHRREGKRFIPPLLDLPVKVDTYWRDVGIPELLWLGLLIKKHGLREGAELAATLAKSAASVRDGKKKWFAKVSSFRELSVTQVESVLRDQVITRRLKAYQIALDPLNRWYPTSPLSFFGTEANDDANRSDLKALLQQMYDRTSLTAMRAQTAAIYIGFVTNMLFIRKGMMLGELELIDEYPDTDRSQQFGASVRASIGALIQGSEGADRSWANEFWQQGFVLERCLFPNIDYE